VKISSEIRLMLAGIMILSFSCGQKGADTSGSGATTFPLEIGNRWEYREYVYILPFNVSSLADTIVNSLFRHIVALDTIQDSNIVHVVDDTLIYSPPNDALPLIHSRWYAINDSKLKEYGFGTNAGGGSWVEVIYREPYILLDFPLVTGKKWQFPSYHLTVEKSVLSIEQFNGAGRSFNCTLIRTDYFEGEIQRLTKTWEWYSNEGLVSYRWGPQRSSIYDSVGTLVDSVDIYEEWELIEYEIAH
jgi:hypothetical protein